VEQKEPIKRGSHLAKIMGGKGRRIRDNLKQFISVESSKNSELLHVYDTLKQMLVHDLTDETFADMYAQTLVYGLFVARYHDDSLQNFSRQEARDLVPASNPFLRHFFDHIAGPNFDKRLRYIVDELCEVFLHADTKKLVEEYMGEADPIIHFYEDFLKEYDPDLRKKMGAYYTPLPVVNFIVRAVDKILEKDFGLGQGLADTTKLPDGTHKVQILDPAVGTGTFISRVIYVIYERILKQKQKGRWTTYVHRELLPRLHGFELMMAPYTIAHLKLSLAFKETGFHYFLERLGIYLTNALEKSEDNQASIAFGLAQSIANESKEAGVIKNDTQVMVVVGNPPYSVSSSNKGEWIQEQIKVYKKDLNEKKINLDDDYIKFIRFAEHFVEKNKSGVVAMITNNSFIDGITHRQMRKHLLETFDDIYIYDLHGNSKKKETAPDGSKDENVFNIQQGVSINIFVRKNENKKGLGTIHHSELFGLRKDKFEQLNSVPFEKVKWTKLENVEPYHFFVPKDFGAQGEYEKGFSVNNVFEKATSGIESGKDDFIVAFEAKNITDLKQFIENNEVKEIASVYGLKLDKSEQVKRDIDNAMQDSVEILYRPFDKRHTLYSPNSQGLWWRPRYSVMKEMLTNNIGFIAKRGMSEEKSSPCYVSDSIIDRRSWSRPGMLGAEQIYPLYIFNEDGTKTSNFDEKIVGEIEGVVGTTTPEDILDYIYAVLHSPSYREKYKEFLKIDFPRVPYPETKDAFWKLVKYGKELREIHLLKSPKVSQYITSFPEEGDDTVDKVSFADGRVHINKGQYFGDVPEVAWNFYIGGYQPAQKWLKDRKGRQLTNEDIEHYQKIIVALTETDRIMNEIGRIT
ncbi:N-6 DNA methylase, partial [Candidatus Kaiserbacteria bacterium]|nr:N-6 DNA methylase [Candidatus Kaiserbacteria bacterium]